ncbi:hypothetical protein T484DRAFT_1642633, partial [Baffinella frigidus]
PTLQPSKPPTLQTSRSVEPQTPNSKSQTPNSKPQTPNLKPQTPNPKPCTRSASSGGRALLFCLRRKEQELRPLGPARAGLHEADPASFINVDCRRFVWSWSRGCTESVARHRKISTLASLVQLPGF